MKRKLLSFLLALIICLSIVISVSASTSGNAPFLLDEADLLSSAEESALSARLMEISQEFNAQVAVVTVPAVENGDVTGFVNTVYDTMGFGYGQNHDGVLLLVCMAPRQYRILSNGFAADAIEDSEIESIGDDIVSDLSDGYYADAFHAFADSCEYYLDGHINGFPFNAGQKLATALVIGIVVGLIVVLILKSQLKSVRKQDQANVYIKPGSMRVNVHHDFFLYRNITRTKRESGSSSHSGGGSSRNVGGGSF